MYWFLCTELTSECGIERECKNIEADRKNKESIERSEEQVIERESSGKCEWH